MWTLMQLFVEIKSGHRDLQFGTYSFSTFTCSNNLVQCLGPNTTPSRFLTLLLTWLFYYLSAVLANKKTHNLCNAVDKMNK